MQGKLLWFLGLWSSSSCSSCPFLCNWAPCSVMEKSGKDGIVASSVTEAWKETRHITILLADWTAVAGSCLIKYSHSPITFCFKQWHLGASGVSVSETGGLFTACIWITSSTCAGLVHTPLSIMEVIRGFELTSWILSCMVCKLPPKAGCWIRTRLPQCLKKECVKSPPIGLPSVISSCYSPKRFAAWIRACYFFVCWFALIFFCLNLFVYLENYWVSFRALH